MRDGKLAFLEVKQNVRMNKLTEFARKLEFFQDLTDNSIVFLEPMCFNLKVIIPIYLFL